MSSGGFHRPHDHDSVATEFDDVPVELFHNAQQRREKLTKGKVSDERRGLA
jgi:hypothetical protein